jgi:hypothetical protein
VNRNAFDHLPRQARRRHRIFLRRNIRIVPGRAVIDPVKRGNHLGRAGLFHMIQMSLGTVQLPGVMRHAEKAVKARMGRWWSASIE